MLLHMLMLLQEINDNVEERINLQKALFELEVWISRTANINHW
jgi:hypothetical protein